MQSVSLSLYIYLSLSPCFPPFQPESIQLQISWKRLLLLNTHKIKAIEAHFHVLMCCRQEWRRCSMFVRSFSCHSLFTSGIKYVSIRTGHQVSAQITSKKMLSCASLRASTESRERSRFLLPTANTHNAIVAIVDSYQAGNKLLLSVISFVYSSPTPCLNGEAINSAETRREDGELRKITKRFKYSYRNFLFE